jgi:hypothetical protein
MVARYEILQTSLIAQPFSRRCGWSLVNAMIHSEPQGFGMHQPDALPHR